MEKKPGGERPTLAVFRPDSKTPRLVKPTSHGKECETLPRHGSRQIRKEVPGSDFNKAPDPELLEATGFDEMTIMGLRRALARKCRDLQPQDWETLGTGHTPIRLAFLNRVIEEVFESDEQRYKLLAQIFEKIGCLRKNVRRMEKMKFPIPPALVMVWSRIFGIHPDFLLVGGEPTPFQWEGPVRGIPREKNF